MGDWSWIDLKSVSSNISSGEVSLSLRHIFVGVNIAWHLSLLLGWSGIVIGWLIYDPVIVFSPGSNVVFVCIDCGEPVLSGSELSNLEFVAVVCKGGLVFQNVEKAWLFGTSDSSWASNARNVFSFRYLKKGKYCEERGEFHFKYYKYYFG